MSGEDPIAGYRSLVIKEMERALNARSLKHGDLLAYHLGFDREVGPGEAPGAYVRPGICLLVCEALGGRKEQALPAAAAIEFLYRFDLVQTDIADERPERAGRPTLWKRWGIALALNAADGMFSLAQSSLGRLRDARVDAERVLAGESVVDEACLRLCEGHYVRYDRERVTTEEYVAAATRRHGSLFAAAAVLGGIVAGAADGGVAALARFGSELGVAAAIRRDYRRIWSDDASGWRVEGSTSYPVIHALNTAGGDGRESLQRSLAEGDRQAVRSLLEGEGARQATVAAIGAAIDSALSALSSLDLNDDWRNRIKAAAHYVGERSVK